MQILVELIGEKIDIEDLKHNLRTSDWKILNMDNMYYIASESLNKLQDSNEILSAVNLFLDILNGAVCVLEINHKTVFAGSIYKVYPNGRKDVSIQLNTIKGFSRVRGSLTIKGDNTTTATTVEKYLKLAEKDVHVRAALNFFKRIAWGNLYKVYEIICKDMNGEKNIYQFCPKSQIILFRRTAQSPDIIGEDARHAYQRHKPPKEIITVKQAHSIIKRLFENWIKSKI